MSPERKIERQLVNYCKLHGVYTRKWTSPGNRGVPDRIIIGRQGTVFLELKAPGKTLKPLQKREAELIRKAGGRAFWASSWHGAKAVVDAVRAEDPVKLLAMDVLIDCLDMTPRNSGFIRTSMGQAISKPSHRRLHRSVGSSIL